MKATGKWAGTVCLVGDKSILTDAEHEIPLTGLSFEGEDGELIIYLIASSPGIFNGDTQEISCIIEEGAHLFLTDTSPTELHPSATDDEMVSTQKFELKKNSILEYVPEAYIPFKGSNFRGNTQIFMNDGSQAIISEIITAGRVGRGELFEYICFKSSFEVFWNNELQVWDTIQLNPENHLRLNGLMDQFTHVGTLWILSEQVQIDHVRHIQNTILSDNKGLQCYGGASLLKKNGLVVRLLGHSSEELQCIMKNIWDYIRSDVFNMQPVEILK